jgi:hypothetical protein
VSRVVFHGVMVRRVIEVVVQAHVLTISHRVMVGLVMNGFPLELACLQVTMVVDVCMLSGMAVRVMTRAEADSQELGQVRCLSRIGAEGQSGDGGEAKNDTFHGFLLEV